MQLKEAKVVTYARELNMPTNVSYEEKFDELVRLCKEAPAQADAVVMASPQVLGDSYEEVMESLRRIANVGLAIIIVPDDKERPS